MSAPIIFTASTLAPGPGVFVFDDIGFGPVSGTLAVNEELLGIPLPLIDAGVTIGYTLGAQIVLTADFATPTVNLNYAVSEGSFVSQTDISHPDAGFQARLDLQDGVYRNTGIVFDTKTIDFVNTGNTMSVVGSPTGAKLSLELAYQLKLEIINAFVELGFPIYEGKTFDIGVTLFDEQGRIDLFPPILEGAPLGEIDDPTNPFDGSFLTAPVTPKFENGADYTVNNLDNGLASVSVYDTGDPFAQLKVDFAKLMAQAGVAPGITLPLGFATGSLNLISAVGDATVAMGQRETFRADDVHVRLELFNLDGVSTGKVVEGRLGDELMFDAFKLSNANPTDLGFGKIKATYTLYGSLEQETGIEVAAGINLGLLTGAVHVDVFGFSASGSFGPLIALPRIDFSSGLIPLVSASEQVAFASQTREYEVYSTRDEVGSDLGQTHELDQLQDFFDAKGGDDYITGFDITANTIYGGAGNDTILGSFAQANPDTDFRDILDGGTGDDFIVGGSADDDLRAGNGADSLFGEAGNDYLFTVGTDGIDILDGGTGTDTAYIDRQGATTGWDNGFGSLYLLYDIDNIQDELPDGTIIRSIENFQLFLGFGADKVIGGYGDDTINGGAGDDTLGGAFGQDILRGESGNDTILFSQTTESTLGRPDQLSGGTGIDTIGLYMNGTEDVAFNLSGQARLLPTANGGIGVYSDLSPSIDGVKLDADSGDYLPLLLGQIDDFLKTVNVADYRGGPDNVALKIRKDFEKLDYEHTGLGRSFITGGYLADSIKGGDADDRLDGLLGADTVYGNGGNDFVVNWDADILLDGGEGDDTLAVIRSGESAKATLIDFLARKADGRGETSDGAIFTGFEHLNFEGSAEADIVKGGFAADIIYGNGGADVIEGRGGGDLIDAGGGNDTVTAAEGLGTGINTYDGGEGMDTLYLDWGVGTLIVDGFDIRFNSDPLTVDLGEEEPVDLGNGSTVTQFERIVLRSGNAADTIVGGTGVREEFVRLGVSKKTGDVIDAGAGDDHITATGQFDVISAGIGDDTVQTGLGGKHKLDGGDGYDTLIINLPFSLNPNQLVANLKTYTYTDDEGVRSVGVKQFRLPDGTVFSNFEKVVFNVETLADIARAAATSLDDFIGVGVGSRIDGGKGNDFLKLQVRVDSPIPDLLGPIAKLRGGVGDDVLQINARAQLDGGEGFDRAEVGFGHLLESISGVFGEGEVALAGARGKRLASTSNIEDVQVTLGAGNDKGTFEAEGSFEVDFGAGIDSVVVKNGADLGGKSYGFGGALPTVRFVFGADELADATAASRVIPTARGFSDGAGLNLSNFERLDLQAGNGDDVIDLTLAPATLTTVKADGGGGFDIIYGSQFADTLLGGAGDDVIAGEGGDDRLEGGSDNDELTGGFGADTLLGGAGNDDLTGGEDGDRFVFDDASLGFYDTINDFNAAEGDLIDLSQIDAIARMRGNQAFTFIGDAPFGRSAAGQLHLVYGAGSILIEGDVTGDGVADFTIELIGLEELDPDSLIL